MTHQCATRTADVSPTTNANRWGNTHRDGAARCTGSRPARAAGRSHRAVAGVARHSHRGIGAHPASAHAVRAGGLPAAGVHHRPAVGTGAVRGPDRACDAAGPGPDARRLEARTEEPPSEL